MFANAQCRVWNDWAWEQFGPHPGSMLPVASIATGDLGGAMKEIERVAKIGFRALSLPCKPIWAARLITSLHLPHFDPMWALAQEADLPITFHVSTGRDPRAARGNGGAVIKYVTRSLSPTIEPVANLCASGVLERFKGLRFATIEAGIGWVPWLLDAMDEAYRKHHMWVRPKRQGLPSDYYRAHGFATFQEDPSGPALAEAWNLIDNFMWASDYPHHEGTWPHSAEAIERTMPKLSETACEDPRVERRAVLQAECAGASTPRRLTPSCLRDGRRRGFEPHESIPTVVVPIGPLWQPRGVYAPWSCARGSWASSSSQYDNPIGVGSLGVVLDSPAIGGLGELLLVDHHEHAVKG